MNIWIWSTSGTRTRCPEPGSSPPYSPGDETDTSNTLVNYSPKGFYNEAFIKRSVACFDKAVTAAKGDKILEQELLSERMLFLQDGFAPLSRHSVRQ